MIKPFKYVVQPVAVEVDESGRPTREVIGQAVDLYTPDQVVDFIITIETQLASAAEE